MPLHYMTGQVIKQGDRIHYAGEPGEVEFVADDGAPDEATAWYLKEHGRGCMIKTSKWGSIFLHETEEEEDLELVARRVPE